MSTTVLEFKISMPIMITPISLQNMAHPDGMHSLSYLIIGILFYYRNFPNTDLARNLAYRRVGYSKSCISCWNKNGLKFNLLFVICALRSVRSHDFKYRLLSSFCKFCRKSLQTWLIYKRDKMGQIKINSFSCFIILLFSKCIAKPFKGTFGILCLNQHQIL